MNELLTIIREKQPILLTIANNINILIQNDEKVVLDFNYLQKVKKILDDAETEYNRFNKELDNLSISDPEKFDEVDDITHTYYMNISYLLDIIDKLLRFQIEISDISVMLYKKVIQTNNSN